MAQRTSALLPASELRLRQFGERIRLARRRRRLTAKQVAERAGMTPVTLRSLENGGPGVTIGAYLAVMQVLGVDAQFDLLLKDDPLGRDLQDAELMQRAPASKQGAGAAASRRVAPRSRKPPEARQPQESESAQWAADSDFVSTGDLSSLIKAPKPKKKAERR